MKKLRIFPQWPKYIMILYNFDKYDCKIVKIRCMLRKKLYNAHWNLPNTT